MNDVIAILRVVLALVALAWIGMLMWRKYGGNARPMLRSLTWQPSMPRKEQARVCPQLGLASDPFTSSPRPDEEHRCYANLARERIDLGHQQRFCLASTYKRCPFLAVAPQEDGVSARARTWWRSVSPAFGSAAISLQPWLSARLEALAARVMATRVSLPKAEAVVQPDMQVAAPQTTSTLVASETRDAQEVSSEVFFGSFLREQTREAASEPEPVLIAEPEPAPMPEAVAPPVHARPMGEVLRAAATHAVEAREEVLGAHAALLQPPTPDAEPMRGDLVPQAVALLEAGHEAEAYQLFKEATKANKNDVHAWYWRAKTAETLDEVVDCLSKALALDPRNEQIAANLARAKERQAAPAPTPAPKVPERRAAEHRPKSSKPDALPSVWTARRPSVSQKAMRLAFELVRAQAALCAFAVAAVWLLSALPPELRDQVMSATGMSWLHLPEPGRLTDMVHFSVSGGYDIGSALPFMIGFLAFFVGVGLMSDDGWIRFWAPVVGVASSWMWAATPAAQQSPLLLLACALVVIGAAASSEWRTTARVLGLN